MFEPDEIIMWPKNELTDPPVTAEQVMKDLDDNEILPNNPKWMIDHE